MTAEDGGVVLPETITLLGQWRCDGTVEAFRVNDMMTIPDPDGVIYVRPQDAMAFFGLVPATALTALQAELDAVRGKLGLRDFAYDQLRERLCHCEAALEERDAQLTASRKEHAALVAGVEGLCLETERKSLTGSPEHVLALRFLALIAAGKGAGNG